MRKKSHLSGFSILRLQAIINGRLMSGSAFPITTDGYLLTAAHCVNGAIDEIQVWSVAKSCWFPVKVIMIWLKQDIALLKVAIHFSSGQFSQPLTSKSIKDGQQLTMLALPGYGKHSLKKEVHGWVDAKEPIQPAGLLSLYSAEKTGNLRGASGSPVFTSSGDLVALFSAGWGKELKVSTWQLTSLEGQADINRRFSAAMVNVILKREIAFTLLEVSPVGAVLTQLQKLIK